MKQFALMFAPLFKFLPVKFFAALTGQHLVLPFYHAVENDVKPHLKHVYPVFNVEMFEKHLDQLLSIYKPVDYNCVLKTVLNREALNENSFMLSFDDGLSSFYHHVAPILKRKGVPAVCFVNNSFIDNKALFYRYKASLIIENLESKNTSSLALNKIGETLNCKATLKDIKQKVLTLTYNSVSLFDDLAVILELDFDIYLKNEQPYLSSDQIKTLIKDGFTIGAHSLDHKLYFKESLDEQLRQTLESIKDVKDTFGISNPLFSFPFTDFGVTNDFFERLAQSPHSPPLTFGSAGIKKDAVIRNVQRIPMEVKNRSAFDVLRSEYLYFMVKSLINKNTIYRT